MPETKKTKKAPVKTAAKKKTVAAKKPATVKKTTVKKAATTAKKPAVKKAPVKKSVAAKPAAKKVVAKKAATAKPVTKKTVAKKTVVKKSPAKAVKKTTTVAKKPAVKKTPAKKVVKKATPVKKAVIKKVVKKTAVAKPVAKKAPVKTVKKTTTVAKKAAKKVATKTVKKATVKTVAKKTVKRTVSVKTTPVSKESFNDRLLRKWLVGNSNEVLSENKFNYFKKMITKFEQRDGKFAFSWNIFAALYNFLYSFFRKDYVGGLVVVAVLKLIDILATMYAVEAGVTYYGAFSFVHLFVLAMVGSSLVNYRLFHKFEADKKVISSVSDKEQALKVMQDLGGVHSFWRIAMIAITIALVLLSIAVNTGYIGI